MSVQPPDGLAPNSTPIPQLTPPAPGQLSALQQAQPSNPLESLLQQDQPQLPELPVNSYDNHAVHIAYHNRFRKSQYFETLPDEAKQIFEAHVQKHQLALQAGMTPQSPNDIYEDSVQGQPGPNQLPPGQPQLMPTQAPPVGASNGS